MTRFTNSTIETAILDLLAQRGPLPDQDDMRAFNYLEAGIVDSLGVMSLVVALEDEFDIEFSEDAMMSEAFRTVGGLTDIIADALTQPSSAVG